jgi:hypothetical protein
VFVMPKEGHIIWIASTWFHFWNLKFRQVFKVLISLRFGQAAQSWGKFLLQNPLMVQTIKSILICLSKENASSTFWQWFCQSTSTNLMWNKNINLQKENPNLF